MKYWYDTEFVEDGKTIVPVSLGIVSEDDRELYLINKEFLTAYFNLTNYEWNGKSVKPSSWVVTNVLDHMSKHDIKVYGEYHNMWPNIIKEFISNSGTIESRDDVELWGYYGAYDHVLLCQTFGPMIDLPEPIPMFTREIMQLRNADKIEVERTEQEHNALYDARHQRKLWKAWK